MKATIPETIITYARGEDGTMSLGGCVYSINLEMMGPAINYMFPAE